MLLISLLSSLYSNELKSEYEVLSNKIKALDSNCIDESCIYQKKELEDELGKLFDSELKKENGRIEIIWSDELGDQKCLNLKSEYVNKLAEEIEYDAFYSDGKVELSRKGELVKIFGSVNILGKYLEANGILKVKFGWSKFLLAKPDLFTESWSNIQVFEYTDHSSGYRWYSVRPDVTFDCEK